MGCDAPVGRWFLDPRRDKIVICPTTKICYLLQELIGSGSAASVFRARRIMGLYKESNELHLDMSEEFAVKLFNLRRLRLHNDYQKEIEKLRREMLILKDIHHPCIVNLFHVIETEDEIYFIMELVSGGELFYQIIKQGCLSEDETRYIVIQIVYALQYLHGKNIMHRDLKPENILLACQPLNNFFHIKVADFGLARFFKSGFSEAKTFVGTPQYWAPEVIDSASGTSSYGPQADLWSLGCVIYVMLGGTYPFDSHLAPVEVLIKRAEFNFHHPRFHSVSSAAKDLIKGLLTVDPKCRMTLKDILQHPWIQHFPPPKCFSFHHPRLDHTDSADHFVFSPHPPYSICPMKIFSPPRLKHPNEKCSNILSTSEKKVSHTPSSQLLDSSMVSMLGLSPCPSRFPILNSSSNHPVQALQTFSNVQNSDYGKESVKNDNGYNKKIPLISLSSKSSTICRAEHYAPSKYPSRHRLDSDAFLFSQSHVDETSHKPRVEEFNYLYCSLTQGFHPFSPFIKSGVNGDFSLPFERFQSPTTLHFYHVWATVFSMFSQQIKPCLQFSERMFNLNELLSHQLFIMQRVNLIYLVLRYFSQAEKGLRNCILEEQSIQRDCIQIIRQCESACYSVLALFPDLFWAVTEGHIDFGVQLLEDVFSWILCLKKNIGYHQKRIETFLRQISDVLELIRSVKVAADYEILLIFNCFGVPFPSCCPLNKTVCVESFFLDSFDRLSQHTGCTKEVNSNCEKWNTLLLKPLFETLKYSFDESPVDFNTTHPSYIPSKIAYLDFMKLESVISRDKYSAPETKSSTQLSSFSSFFDTLDKDCSTKTHSNDQKEEEKEEEEEEEEEKKDCFYWKALQAYYSSVESAVYHHLQCLMKKTVNRMIDRSRSPFFPAVSPDKNELTCFFYNTCKENPDPLHNAVASYGDFSDSYLSVLLGQEVSYGAKELVKLLFLASPSAFTVHYNIVMNHSNSTIYSPSKPAGKKQSKCSVTQNVREPGKDSTQWKKNECFSFKRVHDLNFFLPSFKHLVEGRLNYTIPKHKSPILPRTKSAKAKDGLDKMRYCHHIFRTSKLLSFVLDEFRHIEQAIHQCLAFWMNLTVILEHLSQIKIHTTRLLRWSGTSRCLVVRLEEILIDYREFWLSFKDQLYNYSRDAQRNMEAMDVFFIALCDTAERIDTALAIY